MNQERKAQNEIRHNGVVSNLELRRIADPDNPVSSLQAHFTVRNATSSLVSFTFSSSQQYDFLIQDDTGRELWKWSDGRFFAMLIVEKELALEPWVYQERIPAVDREGRSFPDGHYTLRARLTSNPAIENHLSFQVK